MMHTSVASALEHPRSMLTIAKVTRLETDASGGRTVRLSVMQTITGGIPVPTGNR